MIPLLISLLCVFVARSGSPQTALGGGAEGHGLVVRDPDEGGRDRAR